jgi:hypothetical protein
MAASIVALGVSGAAATPFAENCLAVVAGRLEE